MGEKVRWNGAHKLRQNLLSWADENGIELVSACPENELFGTPRSTIKLVYIEDRIVAQMGSKRVEESLKNKCSEIHDRHSDACGFIGISGSPSCGISVGVKGLGKVTKGMMHKTTEKPTVEYSQMKTEFQRQTFLKRLRKYNEHIRP